MSNDPFSDAGNQFRRDTVRNNAARDQSLAALPALATFCEAGVRRFYGDERTDVYVERFGDGQLSIRFGFRPGKFHRVLTGPWATVFITPDGRVLWSALTRWVEPDVTDPPMQAEALDGNDLEGSLTPRLVQFLQESERQYANSIA